MAPAGRIVQRSAPHAVLQGRGKQHNSSSSSSRVRQQGASAQVMRSICMQCVALHVCSRHSCAHCHCRRHTAVWVGGNTHAPHATCCLRFEHARDLACRSWLCLSNARLPHRASTQ
jgi:hypothetical protein